MRSITFLLLLAITAAPVEAVDLTEIKREIGKQFDYQLKPEYCLLVFGAAAKTRMWLVVDGDYLYIDLNKNGDLTDPQEKIRKSGSSFRVTTIYEVSKVKVTRYELATLNRIAENNASEKHTGFSLSGSSAARRMAISISGEGSQRVGYSRGKGLKFATRPQDAPIVHFNGPKTIGEDGGKQSIPSDGATKGNYRTTWLRLTVGSRGLGDGTFAAYHCKCRRKANLTANVVFANKDGGNPINVTQALEMRG